MSALATAAAVSVVLVHGAFVDGSGWKDVHDQLTKDGYEVLVVQNPTETLAGDVAAMKRAIANASGPVVLVGHSYGGSIISEAGNDPKVAALVYVAAFVPDKGESVASLTANPPPNAPPSPVLPPKDGFLTIDKAKFHDSFAADVDAKQAKFMADSQPGWGLGAVGGVVTEAAWKTKPVWYLVATQDGMIPPPLQQAMAKKAKATTVEVKASHAVMVSQPAAVVDIIEKAAKGSAKK
ncbi:MAG TPA: alpha/beta hydrolase [Rhizomicrobium sp.]|nr:alpha/beta hydrolase [Rhizomicrobium sp.]